MNAPTTWIRRSFGSIWSSSAQPTSRASSSAAAAAGPSLPLFQFTSTDRLPTWMRSWNWRTRFGLIVIEDACQAHGAEYFSRKQNRWMKAGSMGRAAAFSFYPGKNLGACGEAGAVTTNDAGLAKKISMLRDHGQAQKYYHDMEGYNGRLDALQAGLLHAKLAHLAKWNAQRRERAAEYNRLFAAADEVVVPPFEPSWSRAVYHLYVIRTEDRDGMMNHLKKAGIGTGIHYPIPLHLTESLCIAAVSPRRFPCDRKSRRGDCFLANVPAIDREQQARVVEEILSFTSSSTRKQPRRKFRRWPRPIGQRKPLSRVNSPQ